MTSASPLASTLKFSPHRQGDTGHAERETSTPLFSRDDWTLFRSLGTLAQKAGVPPSQLPSVVAKELADNGLDAGGSCVVERVAPNGFKVTDTGPGLAGTPAEIATLFSIARPLISSKLYRLPTRGALGNGLRVVVGAVLATRGTLTVATRGRTLALCPQDDGTTTAEVIGPYPEPGTCITVQLGTDLVVNDRALRWAHLACFMADGGTLYKGKTSPHWYCDDSFYELLQAAGHRPVRDLVGDLDGCSGPKAGQVAAPFLGRAAGSLSREDASTLLARSRALARPVRPDRLGGVGPNLSFGSGYASDSCALTLPSARGQHRAQVPCVIEAWVSYDDRQGGDSERVAFAVHVNRTPVTAPVRAGASKGNLTLSGCNMHKYVPVGRQAPASVVVNIQTPYMPITSDGKAPNLDPLEDLIADVVEKAAGRAKRDQPKAAAGTQRSIADITMALLPQAVAAVSSNDQYRYAQRQLFYAIRPALAQQIGEEPRYETFTTYLTDYEERYGRLPGLYRDPRGTLYHPHTHQEIAVGTLAVEEYERPQWTFNKILYIEKEGFFTILKDAHWPERHDCALLTSKGQASRATKDLLDLLGDTDEDLTFFCIHDADAAGTEIYQALQHATRTRSGRRVTINNLGLDPWEAVAMGLEVEAVSYKKRQPVADYVRTHGDARDEDWERWLQTHRVELNAMASAQFLAWLDAKMAAQSTGKIVPPQPVLTQQLIDHVQDHLRAQITARVLAEARIEDQVAASYSQIESAVSHRAVEMDDVVTDALSTTPTDHWTLPIRRAAAQLVERAQSA